MRALAQVKFDDGDKNDHLSSSDILFSAMDRQKYEDAYGKARAARAHTYTHACTRAYARMRMCG
eukprot:4930033-Pleurochrysis_carterae.AAC.1